MNFAQNKVQKYVKPPSISATNARFSLKLNTQYQIIQPFSQIKYIISSTSAILVSTTAYPKTTFNQA